MATLTFDGEFHRCGMGNDPVVLVRQDDEPLLDAWWQQNEIFTEPIQHKHPITGAHHRAAHLSPQHAATLTEGDRVSVTIDVQSDEQGGNAIRVVNVAKSDH